MKIETALNKLYSLHQFGVKLGLENITGFLNYLNNPQDNLKVFHIAGSNGKGSTASFLASMLMESGFKVGLFTSPHFVKYNERISINGKFIPDSYLINFLNGTQDYIDKYKPTFFEVTTALAFKYFYDNKVDYAVIEVGLGGRLDATNVVNPLASVITTINIEHSHILGKNLEDIAYEKAGIVKPNKPVYIGIIKKNAERSIIEIAAGKKSQIFNLKKLVRIHKDFLSLQLGKKTIHLYKTSLQGLHQLKNAALSLLVYVNEISDYRIKYALKGIDNVLRNTNIQGRYEVINDKPKIILDSAHNPDSVKVFVDEFSKNKYECENKILIFGAMKDKNISQMLKLLKNHFDKIFLTSINYERAATVEELKSVCVTNNINAEILNKRKAFLEKFAKNNKKDCLVILGSIYLLGEVKRNGELRNSLTF